MKKIFVAPILIAVALLALPAFAADSNTLMIFSFKPGLLVNGVQHYDGSFNAAGVIHENATADSTVGFDPATGILSANKVIHLFGGDIEMYVQGPLSTVNGADVWLTGTWEFTRGTGLYSDITGSGTCAVVGNLAVGTFSGAYQGKVKLANDRGKDASRER
jgi:hypothetical protein